MRNMKYLIKLVKLKEIIEIASGEKCEQNYIDTKLNVNKQDLNKTKRKMKRYKKLLVVVYIIAQALHTSYTLIASKRIARTFYCSNCTKKTRIFFLFLVLHGWNTFFRPKHFHHFSCTHFLCICIISPTFHDYSFLVLFLYSFGNRIFVGFFCKDFFVFVVIFCVVNYICSLCSVRKIYYFTNVCFQNKIQTKTEKNGKISCFRHSKTQKKNIEKPC